jgi:hypothetical protein
VDEEEKARLERLARVAEGLERKRASILGRAVSWMEELGVLDPLDLEESSRTGEEHDEPDDSHDTPVG